MVANSRVLIASANLRDLGGLPTIDGRRVRTGQLFRSGHLAELNRAEAAILNGLGLRTIIDLRRPSEVAKSPTPDLDGVDRLWISVSPEDSEFVVAADLLAGKQPEKLNTTAMIEDYFRNTVTNRLVGYQPVFEAATDPNRQPLLFHCMAGKDRTGFVAGVLLRLLGVCQEEVMADYLLTNEILSYRMAYRMDQIRLRIAQQSGVEPDQVDESYLEGVRAMLYTQPSFLQASFDAITNKFGNWEAFRRDGLGINDTKFSAFLDGILDQ